MMHRTALVLSILILGACGVEAEPVGEAPAAVDVNEAEQVDETDEAVEVAAEVADAPDALPSVTYFLLSES